VKVPMTGSEGAEMNNFSDYLTPAEVFPRQQGFSLAELIAAAEAPPALCYICEVGNVWRLAMSGMCFTCTTGEADASDDYELAHGKFDKAGQPLS
jgi:hypothetical protein